MRIAEARTKHRETKEISNRTTSMVFFILKPFFGSVCPSLSVFGTLTVSQFEE